MTDCRRTRELVDKLAIEHGVAAARAKDLGRVVAASPLERVRVQEPGATGWAVIVRQSFQFLKPGQAPPPGWTVPKR